MFNIIGIDLGASRSMMAIMQKDIPLIIPAEHVDGIYPSVVAFDSTGKPLVGRPAQQQAAGNPENTIFAVKRLLGRSIDDASVHHFAEMVPYEIVSGTQRNAKIFLPARQTTVTPSEILGKLLQSLQQEAEIYLGETVDSAVITTPACFNDCQRQVILEAGRIAGLEVLSLIDEPLAAALAYSMSHGEDQTLLIFDLGAGKLDVSILGFEDGAITVEATNGDAMLGGDDWSHCLAQWLLAEFKTDTGIDLVSDLRALQRLWQAAEAGKIELSTLPETEIKLPFITADSRGPKHLNLKQTRTQFEHLTRDLVDRCAALVDQTLRDADISGSALDAVLLLGGASQMPVIRERLQAITGKAPAIPGRSNELVALGAAIQARLLGVNVAQNVSEFLKSVLSEQEQPRPERQSAQAGAHGAARTRYCPSECTIKITLAEAFSGTRRTLQQKDGRLVEVKIPPGVRDGAQLDLAGRVKTNQHGQFSAEQSLGIEVEPDPDFERVGDHLRVTVPLDLHTALLGGRVSVSSIDRTVNLQIPAGTDHGTTFRLRGLGMPHFDHPTRRGDLYATVDLKLPKDLTSDEKQLLRRWQKMRH